MKMGKSKCGCMGMMEDSEMKDMMNEQDSSFTQANKALNILKQRYAKGEITLEQYEEMKEEILK